MKIGIITQPLNTNYGGLLQNYALQQVLNRLGHDAYTINHNIFSTYTRRWDIMLLWRIKQFIKKVLGREYYPSYKEFYTTKNICLEFVRKNIQTTPIFKNEKELQNIIKTHQFKAYVVGSDQVWRPCYSSNIYNDFLNFCKEETSIKRIAYAASFGVKEWEFSEEQTEKCAILAKLFNAISVREDSSINLCKEFLGVDATHVLDPTLLLEKEDYIKLVEKANEPTSNGKLFCYILDDNEKIKNSIQYIEQKLSVESFQVKAKICKGTISSKDNINDFIVPSPTKWLRAFMDTEMVFTDSFHGCVFSIIFNKPFWIIGNKERGNARFDSLLKLFELENRLVDVNELKEINLTTPINWNRVNSIKKEWQNKSIKFLEENLQ